MHTNRATLTCALALTLMLVAWALPAWGQVAGPTPGTYRVEGTNPNGTTYKGQATIAQAAEGFRMIWTIAGQSFSGTGRMEGGSLVIRWQGPSGNGMVIYRPGPQGIWRGLWDGPGVSDPAKMRGREILHPLPK